MVSKWTHEKIYWLAPGSDYSIIRNSNKWIPKKVGLWPYIHHCDISRVRHKCIHVLHWMRDVMTETRDLCVFVLRAGTSRLCVSHVMSVVWRRPVGSPRIVAVSCKWSIGPALYCSHLSVCLAGHDGATCPHVLQDAMAQASSALEHVNVPWKHMSLAA
jgi:hypothetical protein